MASFRPLRVLISSLAAIAVATAQGAASAQTTTTYKYDATGRLLSATNSDGKTVVYVYDEAGNRTRHGIGGLYTEHTSTAFSASSTESPSGLQTSGKMRDTDFVTRSSTHITLSESNPWVRVDLGARRGVDHIEIAAASDAALGVDPSALNGAIIEFSDDAVSWKTAATVTGVAAGSLKTFSLRVATRYVQIRRPGSGRVALGDFRLFSAGEPANSGPTPVNDNYSTTLNTPLQISPQANDTDPQNDALAISSVTTPVNGTTNISGAYVTYAPKNGFAGTDTFTYYVTDGTSSAPGTVSVVVGGGGGGNLPPNTVNDTKVAQKNTALPFDPRTNDTDPEGGTLTITAAGTPSNGGGNTTVTGGGTGITFTPTSGFTGVTNFSYTVADPQGATAPGNVSVTVNAPPVAAVDTKTTGQNIPLSFDPRLNDSDSDGGTLSITAVTTPTNLGGNAAVTGGGGGVTYTPANNFTGATSFSYTLVDGQGGSATGTVNVTVSSSNQSPSAVNDTKVAQKNTALSFDPRTNDSDPEGGALTITVAGTPSNSGGTTAITGGGTGITFTPASNFTGATSFSYTIADPQGATSSATVSVTVNAPPVAVTDTKTTAQNAALSFDPRTNDSDPDGGTLSVSAVGSPSNSGGTAAITGGGTGITYTPANNFTGSTSFSYTLSDGQGGTATGTVNVTVTSGPTGWIYARADDQFELYVNGVQQLTGASWNEVKQLSIDLQPGDVIALHGLDTQNPGGAFVDIKMPNGTRYATSSAWKFSTNPTGAWTTQGYDDSNWYGASEYAGLNGSWPWPNDTTPQLPTDSTGKYIWSWNNWGDANVYLRFTIPGGSSNQSPSAVNDTKVAQKNTALSFDPRTNDTDPEGGALTITVAGTPSSSGGTTAITGGGTGITFTPASNFTGSTSFSYTLSDGQGGAAAGTVNVTVSAGGQISVRADNAYELYVNGVLKLSDNNFRNAETVVMDLQPGDVIAVHGVNVAWSSGVIVDVRLTNGARHGSNSSWLVSPTASGAWTTAGYNTSSWVAATEYGALDGGSWTGTGEDPFMPADTTAQWIWSSNNQVNNGEVFIRFVVPSASNQSPSAVNDTKVAQKNTALSFDPRTNDTDPEGGALTITVAGTPSSSGGTTAITGGGTGITFTPASNFTGATSFSYTIADPQGATSSATVSVTVNAPPVAVTDTKTTAQNAALSFDPRTNDSDPDGGTLSVSAVGAPSNSGGTAAITGGGTGITYTPASNFTGSTSFSYTLSDGQGGTATGTVNVTVSAGGTTVTWDPNNKSSNITLSNGNLTATHASGDADAVVKATATVPSGAKRYFEITYGTTTVFGYGGGGVCIAGQSLNDSMTYANGLGVDDTDGAVFTNGNQIGSIGSLSSGAVVGFAIDDAQRKVWIHKNGAYSGDPANNTGGFSYAALSGAVFPCLGMYNGNNVRTANFGATTFAYTPPSGFTGF